MNLPLDPAMLLSVVNTNLRDRYPSLEEFAAAEDVDISYIKKQLAKLEEVEKIVEVEPSSAVFRELMLVKVWASAGSRAGIIEICNVFHATIADLSPTTATIEMTSTPAKNNAFLDLLAEYGILEVARTGAAGLQRGEKHLSLEK